jgi:ornithine cyclodeaminase/alanine dehydrogenase-like protein (mu-crystallin family)
MRDLKSTCSVQGAMKESGDVIFSVARIYAELSEALDGKIPSRANEITIFKSLGMGGGRYCRGTARLAIRKK